MPPSPYHKAHQPCTMLFVNRTGKFPPLFAAVPDQDQKKTAPAPIQGREPSTTPKDLDAPR